MKMNNLKTNVLSLSLSRVWSLFYLIFIILTIYHNQCVAYTAVEESSTGAIVTFPEVSDGDLYNVTWEVEPAAFGFADYGGTLEAFLVLPLNKTYRTECVQEPEGGNTYIHYVADFLGKDKEWVLVIDRGDCYFATKVYNAQQLGAAGVIVIDNKQEDLFPMWEPDNFEHDITIPSVEMSYNNGTILMAHLGVRNWDPNEDTSNPDPANITNVYPQAATTEFQLTKVVIEWGLPHEDDRVEWELWTSSNDDRTIEFKHNFASTSIRLNGHNYTTFTPHYYILNGTHWSCDTKYRNSWRCGNQCTNSGRYCAVDPEYDMEIGVSGEDVVRENLRQLCIWNFTTHGDPSIHNESVWWEYSNLWNDKCFNGTETEERFTSDCSYEQMRHLESKGVEGLSDYVENCVNATGGYGTNDGVNKLMEYEVTFREDLSVYVLPSFRVNEFMIFGEVDCEQVTEDGCSVLDSICSGFIEGTQPPACYRTPSPTPYNCTAADKDCEGTCYGTKKNDRCGKCLETTSNKWNSCVGCDNVTNSGMETNPCGYCRDSTLSDFDTYGEGCDGVCNSDYETDDCGICRLTYSSNWNGCFGCDGVAHSGREFNPCGMCILNTTNNFNTYGMDCNNDCEGTKKTDRCGQCLETTDKLWDSCITTTNPTYSVAIDDPVVVKKSQVGGLSAAVWIIGVVAFIVIIIAAVVIYKLYKKQQTQSRQFQSILKTYTLMDENPSQQGQAQGQDQGQGLGIQELQGQEQGKKSKNPFKNRKNKGRMQLPTEDLDIDELESSPIKDDSNAVV